MELKDFVNTSKNKKNKQEVFTLRKRALKKEGISMKDLLNLKVGKIK